MASVRAVLSIALIAVALIATTFILRAQTPAPILPVGSDLGGPARYLTSLSTAKPIYRPGEKLYVRGVILRADGHLPMPNSGMAFIEIKGPKGETVMTGSAAIMDSTVGLSWTIPTTQAGGEYTVRVSHPLTGDAPA